VRQNRDCRLFSFVYGRIIAEHIDPIEKKALFNFFRGSTAYSIGTMGCNFLCKHCQNSDISQYPRENRCEVLGEHRTHRQIVEAAKTAGCRRIAYTYTEPTVFFEFAYDTAVLAQRVGLKNIFVSNGYMSADAIRQIVPYLEAINIEIKAFTDNFMGWEKMPVGILSDLNQAAQDVSENL
jgi:pyruvate formate lyase activating enzyme